MRWSNTFPIDFASTRNLLIPGTLCYYLNPVGTQPRSNAKLLFGAFEYDDVSGHLTKYGITVRLQGKPLQILLLLASQPGQVVSRDELKRHLWQGTTFVDFEQGLNSAVNKLRQTLGDSADQPRYVETLAGRGYRFIAPVQQASTKAVLEMPTPTPLRIEPKLRRRLVRWRIVFGSLALILILAGGGHSLSRRSAHSAQTLQTMRFAVVPPPGFAFEGAASRQSFALSPDGTRLAFTATDASGSFSVFLRDFNSLQPQLLPGSEGAHTVFWPPDGR